MAERSYSTICLRINVKPQFVRVSGNVVPFVRKTPPVDNSLPADITDGYSPMAEEPMEQLLKKSGQQIRPISNIKTATPLAKLPAGKKIGDLNPQELTKYRDGQQASKSGSQQWLQQNPSSAQNIVDHWNKTTPDHKEQGMNWYPDAHHAAKQIASDHGISVNQASGLIANYSPQQHWAQNLRMASLAAGGQVVGGKKIPGQEGFMASSSQAQVAQRILNGEDYHNIFAGQKITAFGHLIEHGGDTDPNNPNVVVDRHALGVAHGGYADDGVYTHSGVSSKPAIYDQVAQHYKDAADMINASGGHNGQTVQPHQLQAATWLTRQRLNMEEGYNSDNPATASRVQGAAEGNTNKWNEYASVVHPSLVGKVPGTGFSAATQQGGAVASPPIAPQQAVASKIARFVRLVKPQYVRAK